MGENLREPWNFVYVSVSVVLDSSIVEKDLKKSPEMILTSSSTCVQNLKNLLGGILKFARPIYRFDPNTFGLRRIFIRTPFRSFQ